MEYMVSIICTAYNHERYIRQAIESFLAQKTNFKFEVLINDDASTDRTADIIREYEKRYPEIIFPVYQEKNLYSQGIKITPILLERARGKYIAVCEGDDFWLYPYKLQKQVDFLEAHSDYSLCVHAGATANEKGEILQFDKISMGSEDHTVTMEELLAHRGFPTNAIVYPRAVRTDLEIPFQGNCVNGDYAQMFYLGSKGKVYYFAGKWSAYRVTSVGSITDKYRQNVEKYKRDVDEHYRMMDRMDAYTNGEYHREIENHKMRILFGKAIGTADIKEAKKYSELYKGLSFNRKASLYLRHFGLRWVVDFVKSEKWLIWKRR